MALFHKIRNRFKKFAARAMRSDTEAEPLVDIIVPVYGQPDLAIPCIQSVLETVPANLGRLVVVDDCSADLKFSAWLRNEANGGAFDLVRNTENHGFVFSVNRGMRCNPTRDVVLLNSDTVVTGSWLVKLITIAQTRPKVGSVTPWSNNATICSLFNWPIGDANANARTASEIDRVLGELFPSQSMEIPTGVGFCMYITRACLDEIGYFDNEAFGRGYGEENDYCMRARSSGYHHLIALDTYVFHAGGASFGNSATEARKQASAVIRERWPDYDSLVGDFVRTDPLAPFRIGYCKTSACQDCNDERLIRK